jgi:two-component system, cell cycle sensor histidine kinase and response regulator CckA
MQIIVSGGLKMGDPASRGSVLALEMIESAEDGFVAFDDQFRCVYVNPAAERIFGVNAADLIGRTRRDVLPEPAEHGAVKAEYFSEAQRKWFESSAVPSREGGLLLRLRDLSDRKRTEEDLARALERLTAHVEYSPLAVIEFDSRFQVIGWSEEAHRLFGWSAEEILGRTIPEIRWVHEDDAAMVRELFSDLISGKRPRCLIVNRNYRKDGTVIECEWYNSAIRDGRGRTSSVLTFVLGVNARQADEAGLHERELQQRTALDTADLGSWRHDLATDLVHMDARSQRHGGFADRVVPFAEVRARVHPEDGVRFADEVAAARNPVSGNGTYALECRLIRPGGQVRWMSLRGFFSFEGEGAERRAVAGIGTSQDITERKQAEEILHRFELLARHSRDIILFMERDGRILEANTAAVQAYGYTREELLAMTIRDLRDAPTQELIADQMTVADSETILFETVHRRKDGSTFPAEVSSKGADVGGRRTLISVVRDITRRKKMEEALRVSEERFRRALDNIPDLVTIYDRDLRIQYVNAATTRVTGRPASDFLGRRDDEIWPPEVYGTYLPALREALESRKTGALETEVVLPANERHALHVIAVPLVDGAGEVREVLGITHDFTERKRAEERLRSAALFPEQNPAPVLRIAGDGSLLFSNRAAELLTAEWRRASGTEVPEFVRQETELALADNRPREFEIHCGAREIWFMVTPFAERGYANLYGRDVTDRNAAARLLAEAKNRQELLAEVVGRLLEAEEPQAVVNDLARKVMESLDCDVFFNFMADDRQSRLHLNACAGVGEAEGRAIEWIDYGSSVCGCVARDGRRMVAENILASSDPATEVVRGFGVRAYACHPLLAGGKIIGTLGFGSRKRDRVSENDLSLMQAVSNHIAIAMERVRAQKLLRESEALHRAIAESIPDGGVWVVDPQLRFVVVEGSLTGTLEMSREGLEGLTIREALGESERRSLMEERYRRALGGERAGYVTEYGEQSLWVQYVPLRDESGQITAAMALVLDITERKRIEDALRAGEMRERARAAEFEAIMDAVPAAVLVARDRDCRDVVGSRMTYPLLGLCRGDEPMTFRAMKDGAELPHDRLPVQQAARTGEAVRDFEFELVHDDGTTRQWFGNAVPLLDFEGRPSGAVAAFLDITERKRVEEQLRHAQKLESIGVLAGGVAHDFNNLLTGVLGNASLALDDAPPEICGRLDGIIEAAEKAAQLTRQLLAYAGKGQFEIRDFDLCDVIRSSADLIRISIPKNVTLVQDVPRRLPLIRGDSVQIQQVVMNLVINAAESIDKTSNGTVRLRAGVKEIGADSPAGCDLAPRRYVYLEVLDTGCGMDEETRAKIFDPFFTTKFTGRGLGLAAVQGILGSHKGAITVRSSPGEGSTLTVYLPAVEAAQVHAPPQEPETAARRKLTVLVVDDEPTVRDFAKAALERSGHRVLLAANGREALRMLETSPAVDLVLLDVVMPVIGGGETLNAIRKQRPELTVLITSGYNREEARRLGSLPADLPFIGKPYTAQSLAKAVQQAFDDRPAPSRPRP